MFSSEIKSVHFTGICGTAMASAAVAMKEKGFAVTGSDQNVYPPMSTFLAERQIEVINGFGERNLAHQPDLVVIGNAWHDHEPVRGWHRDLLRDDLLVTTTAGPDKRVAFQSQSRRSEF